MVRKNRAILPLPSPISAPLFFKNETLLLSLVYSPDRFTTSFRPLWLVIFAWCVLQHNRVF